MHLAPDEHVLGGQRDLLVAVADVGADVGEDLVARQIDLRVEIRHAELAAPARAVVISTTPNVVLVGKMISSRLCGWWTSTFCGFSPRSA